MACEVSKNQQHPFMKLMLLHLKKSWKFYFKKLFKLLYGDDFHKLEQWDKQGIRAILDFFLFLFQQHKGGGLFIFITFYV